MNQVATTPEQALAAKIAVKLNQLGWPETGGPLTPRPHAEHVVCNELYSVSVGPHCRTVLFWEKRGKLRHKFMDEHQAIDADYRAAWIAVEFLDWARS